MTDTNEISQAMDEMLVELVFHPTDPEDFLVWVGDVEYRGREGLRDFREKYG